MYLHPRLLKAISQLLDTPEDRLRLTQATAGGKPGTPAPASAAEMEPKGWGNSRGDQPMHLDFGNNT